MFKENIGNEEPIEQLFIYKNRLFNQQFSKYLLSVYFPWNSNRYPSTLPYNPILIPSEYHHNFINNFNSLSISVLKNPTYKCFENSPQHIKYLIDNIIYLPNLHKLSEKEIILLGNYLKLYLSKINL